jgi:hypothetical protein
LYIWQNRGHGLFLITEEEFLVKSVVEIFCLFAQKGQRMIHRDVLVVEKSKVVQLMEATILYAVK